MPPTHDNWSDREAFLELREELRVFIAEQRGIVASRGLQIASIENRHVALERKIDADIKKADARHEIVDKRLAGLENFKSQILGAVAASGVLGGVIGFLLQRVLGG